MSARPRQDARRIVPVLLLVGILILIGLIFDRAPPLHGAEELAPDVESVGTTHRQP